jgi:hypothetical protein
MLQRLIGIFLLVFSNATWAQDYENLPYQRLQQKSAHNAYQRKESIEEQLRVYQLRSLELDIYPTKWTKSAPAADWFVYHAFWDPQSSVYLLSDGLAALKKFHDENPEHDVITLWMDIKAPFGKDGHLPTDLDKRLQEDLGSMIFSPADLLERCPGAITLQQSIQEAGCEWPSLQELRGRIMIVFTSSPIGDYVAHGTTASQRLAFIAPQIEDSAAIARFPYAVFFNVSKSVALATGVPHDLHAQKLIGRTWDVNDAETWRRISNLPLQHIATNKVNTEKDPWATTLGEEGHAFQIIPPSLSSNHSTVPVRESLVFGKIQDQKAEGFTSHPNALITINADIRRVEIHAFRKHFQDGLSS